jgi:hypothetical protein
MALNTQLSNLAVNTEGDALSVLFNNGYLRVYDGSQPSSADTAITTQNMLVELTFNSPAFGAASGGILTANAINSAVAVYTGTATWFRAFKSDGTSAIVDGSVDTASANLVLGTTSITVGLTVSVTSFTHTIAKSYPGI